jgi:hypothetical protein
MIITLRLLVIFRNKLIYYGEELFAPRPIPNLEDHPLSAVRDCLFNIPNIIRMIKSRRMRWAGHVARTGEKRNAHRILVGKLEGKRPLGRPRRGWVDNIKRDLREIGWDGIDWINLAQDRGQWRALVNMVMNLWVP